MRPGDLPAPAARALDAIARMGHVSVIHHPRLGAILGSTAAPIGVLRALARRGLVEGQSFATADGIEFSWFTMPGAMNLPEWAAERRPNLWETRR